MDEAGFQEALRGARDGDRIAQDHLLALLLGVAKAMLAERPPKSIRSIPDVDREDVLEQAVTSTINGLGGFRGGFSDLCGYFYRIWTNKGLDYWRKRKRDRMIVSIEKIKDLAAPEASVARELSRVLWNAVESLSEPCRTLLRLWAFEESPTELIRDLGMARIQELLSSRMDDPINLAKYMSRRIGQCKVLLSQEFGVAGA